MGNCHKKIKVEPLVVKDSASEILSRGSQFAKPDGEQQADMVKDLKDQGKHSHTYILVCLILFFTSHQQSFS